MGLPRRFTRTQPRFFDNTYPTDGLKFLLDEALGRLTGAKPTHNAVIRLETAFGGGKTYNLIALYHAAGGDATPAMVRGMVDPTLLPQPGQVRVAGVVGHELDPINGLTHDDGTTTYTLWGELAYQLGRYDVLAASDPGTGRTGHGYPRAAHRRRANADPAGRDRPPPGGCQSGDRREFPSRADGGFPDVLAGTGRQPGTTGGIHSCHLW